MMSQEDAACQGPAAAAADMLVTGFTSGDVPPEPVRATDQAREGFSLLPCVRAAAAMPHLMRRL